MRLKKFQAYWFATLLIIVLSAILTDVASAATSVIDVLVVYTPNARNNIKGLGGTDSTARKKLDDAIKFTNNTIYPASGITTPSLRFLHAEAINYTESGSTPTDLNRLVSTTDAIMDSVHTLRNTYSADIVVLITNTTDSCGRAQQVPAKFATAFAVVGSTCLGSGKFSLAHEIAHLQGTQHDVYVNQRTTPVTIPYRSNGQGYVHIGSTAATSQRTVMAYEDECKFYFQATCKRYPIFSNPTKSFSGTTIAAGKVGVSENYKVLNDTTLATTIAGLVPTKIGLNFDSQFNSSSNGWTPIQGTWGVTSTAYYTYGILGKTSSSRYAGVYGDITYTASMYRAGCTNCANVLMIRGNPTAGFSADGYWKSSYIFKYTQNGQYSVAKISSTGVTTTPIPWAFAPTGYINLSDWNTLKVVAVGSSLRFYINGYPMTSTPIIDTDFSVGVVGLGMFKTSTSSTTTDYLLVDYANITTAPAAI